MSDDVLKPWHLRTAKEIIERQAREDARAWQEIERKMNMAPDTVKGIQHVAVKKSELIDALKKNREQHKKDYDEGMAGYRDALVLKLSDMLADAKANKDVLHHIALERPEEHLEDYDQLIQMLEMSVDDTVLLTQQEFRQYVMDKWSWKERFTNSTEGYKTGRR